MDEHLTNLSTIEYYNSHAKEYCDLSRNIDMADLYCEFEKYLLPNGKILDVGCGSGRDSAYFSRQGFTVTAIDLSMEICNIASKIPDITVINTDFSEIQYVEEFDGIWACASLLHVPKSHMNHTVDKLFKALKYDGVLYASWKYGRRERYDEHGRFYSDYNKKSLVELFSKYNEVEILKCWITVDSLNRNDHKWINILIRKHSFQCG